MVEDKAIILKLERKKVATRLAQNEKLDVVQLLRDLSGRELPQNVIIELEEWSGHSEAFTLYEGFSLLEGDSELAGIDDFTAEQISPTCVSSRPRTNYLRSWRLLNWFLC